MRNIVKKILFFFCILFLCISCSTTPRVFFDGGRAGEVRKDIGRIEGVQQTFKTATERIEGYSKELEDGIDREGGLIEELTIILRRIRERGVAKSKGAIKEYCLFKKSIGKG